MNYEEQIRTNDLKIHSFFFLCKSNCNIVKMRPLTLCSESCFSPTLQGLPIFQDVIPIHSVVLFAQKQEDHII